MPALIPTPVCHGNGGLCWGDAVGHDDVVRPSQLGNPDISVIIVNWNARDGLAACLRALDRQTDQGFETIVVDNGSTDGSAEMVASAFPDARLVQTGANLGFAEGCNRGIAVSSGAWVFLLNNDAIADEGLVAALRARVRKAGPQDGMYQARILFIQAPDRTNSTGIVLFRDGKARDRDFDKPRAQSEQEDEIFCPTAGAALYRRSMLDEVRLASGWLDRSFFMYAEDLDLGWRCRLAGWRAYYAPEAVVHHAFQGSSRKHGPNFVELQCMKNRVRTLLRNASPSFLLRSLPTTLLDAATLVRWKGPGILGRAVRNAPALLRERREIARHARVDRARIEAEWAFSRRDPRVRFR